MRAITILSIIALLIVSHPSNADEVYLGLKTYHFDRGGRDCLQEEHHLYAYRKGDYHIGTYENSQCMRSYLLGVHYDLGNDFGADISLVSGYPPEMWAIEGIDTTIIPMFTYTKFIGSIGFKAIFVPSVLVGIGGAIRF